MNKYDGARATTTWLVVRRERRTAARNGMRRREIKKDRWNRARLCNERVKEMERGRERERRRSRTRQHHRAASHYRCPSIRCPCGPWYTILLRYHTGFVVVVRSKTAAEEKEREIDIAAPCCAIPSVTGSFSRGEPRRCNDSANRG